MHKSYKNYSKINKKIRVWYTKIVTEQSFSTVAYKFTSSASSLLAVPSNAPSQIPDSHAAGSRSARDVLVATPDYDRDGVSAGETYAAHIDVADCD